MNKSFINKSAISYVGIIISFILVAYLYMFPLLEGDHLRTHDLTQHNGMAKELRDFKAETGEQGLWTNSMFCGMPGYLIFVRYPGNLISPLISKLTPFSFPIKIIVIYLIGFFILLSSLKINKWLCLIGAFAFAFSSYFIIIIGAGHTSKAYAIGFLPLIAAGLILIFNKKTLPGLFLYSLGLTLEISSDHYQITYYGAILFLIFMVVEFIFSLKEKLLPDFVKKSLFVLAGTILALGVNFASLFTIYEYSQETIRGSSELTFEKDNETSGLNKEYILRWSQGIDETLTLLIPNFKGGSSDMRPDNSTKVYDLMRQRKISDINKGLSQIYYYHGDKPGTSGPVYAGAVIVFLFILGLFLVKGRFKWWLLSATVISIILSWGRHFLGLTNFLLDHLPLYNKFRAPEMILVIAEFALPLLAIITLNKIIQGKIDKKELFRSLKWSVIITGGVTLLFSVLPGIFDNFEAITDIKSTGKVAYPDWLYGAILDERKNLLRADAFRSFLLVLLSAGILYFTFYKQKLKSGVAIVMLGILIFGDLWFVDKRYLNNKSFEKPRVSASSYSPTVATQSILPDTDINYRVLPIVNRFNDAFYSYFHKNILGYHAAKLMRPHELLNGYVVYEMKGIYENFKEQVNPTIMPSGFKLVNMLNARYIIYADNRPAIKNPYAMGNAWFVDSVKIVENADEEFLAIKDFNPITTALVDKRFSNLIAKQIFEKTVNDEIKLTDYKPNYAKYSCKTHKSQVVVFSEVYYDKGWDAFIDGEKKPYFRANYMLRGMVVPEGEHSIEFKFEPQSYYIGNKISLASSIIFILLFLGIIGIEGRKIFVKRADSGKK